MDFAQECVTMAKDRALARKNMHSHVGTWEQESNSLAEARAVV